MACSQAIGVLLVLMAAASPIAAVRLSAMAKIDPVSGWQGVKQSCRLAFSEPESDPRWTAWLNMMALQGKAATNTLDGTKSTGIQGHLTITAQEATRAAAVIAKQHGISVSDAVAVCAAVGLEQLSQVRILSHGKGLRVGRLDASAPADQVPSTKACPVEQLKALMHKLDLLDDKDALKPDAYLKALEAVGTFSEDATPVYMVPSADIQMDTSKVASRRLAATTSFSFTTWWQNNARQTTTYPPPAITITTTATTTATTTTTTATVAPTTAPITGIFRSPFVVPEQVCVTKTGQSVFVGIHPATPFPLSPFQKAFKDPARAQKYTSSCNWKNGHCMDAYQINIQEIDVDLGVGCPAGIKTKMLSYNGMIPGPTMDVPAGRQTLVRYNNQINPGSKRFPAVAPCDGVTRPKGRPASIHVHGMASLAPYDGFALDRLCSGESKDYVYPNNRAASLWYHDHALDISSENAYGGLSGMYIVRESPDRWGLEGMEEKILVLQDKTMDSQCQLLFDTAGSAREDFWGDINLVNGVPWPVLNVDPKWYRFRILSGAVSRAWLLSIRDDLGNVYSNKMCQVIAGDGGYRRSPIPFPDGGLYLGMAERYEIVCDFSQVKGKTLYLFNQQDISRMADAPFFCYTHLVMKIVVSNYCSWACSVAPKFKPPVASTPTTFDKLFTPTEYNLALTDAMNGNCRRTFVFNQTNGQWTINGETWQSQRVAAGDVGSNAWEVWCLEGATGDHPVHFHLIDFYILKRFPQGDYQTLEPFETDVPKDVMVLHPGAKVAGLARWGPHRGEYMFHCHNLRHEDTAMMRTFNTNNRIASNDQQQLAQTQAVSSLTFSSILGKLYDTYADPVLPMVAPTATNRMPLLTSTYLNDKIAQEIYRIFYPGVLDDLTRLCDPAINPWLVNKCKTTTFGR